MRPRLVWTIYRKELVDSLRDRRTLLMMIGLPILLYPLLIIGAAKLQESQQEASEARVSRVAVWGEVPAELGERLEKNTKLSLSAWEGASPEVRQGLESGKLRREAKEGADAGGTPLVRAAREVTLSRKVDAVLVCWPGLAESAREEGLGYASVLYDSVRPDSAKARDRLSEEIRGWRTALLAEREERRGLLAGFTTGVELNLENIAPPQRKAGMLLGTVLCFLLVFMSALGGFYSAIDLTAGEKERGTMQTLLCAPVSSAEIIAGKFLTVWTISMVASVANIGSMGITTARIAAEIGEFRLTPDVFALSLAVLLPISFTLSAIYLAVAAFARDFKEGQNYLTPVMTALMLPLVVIMNPAVELNAWTVFVPVINVALLVKALFLGEAGPDAVFLTLLSSAAYAALAILFAARVFERETVMLGGKEPVRSLFQIEGKRGGRPTAALALVMFAVVLVVNFYGQLLLRNAGTVVLLTVALYGFFLLPVLGVSTAMRFSFRDTFALRPLGWAGLAASILIGVSGWLVGLGLFVRLLPPPESLVNALERILLIDGKPGPLWLLWLLIAVSPAICEEAVFRGFIMSGLGRLGKWPAIFGTALLFALAHSSVYRMLPGVFLGLLMCYAVWKTGSIAAGAVIHLLNNGLAVALARSPELAERLNLSGLRYPPWDWTVAAAALTLAGLWLLWRLPERA